MLVLNANKTKMLRLVRSMGYNPPKSAKFAKAYRSRHWWLEWEDENNFYEANLGTHGGNALWGMRWVKYGSDNSEMWTVWELTPEQLLEFELVKELMPQSQAPKNQQPCRKMKL